MAGINLQVSGQLTPDSGVARMAAGLRESIVLGPVHIHPRSIVRLAAYLPLTIGLLFAAGWVLAAPTAHRPAGLALTILSALLIWRTRLNPLWLIAAGALAGAFGLL